MDLEKELSRLIERIENIVPYITATIGPGCTFPSKQRSDWIEIHKGRAFSSRNQLENLLKEAQRIKEELSE